MNSLWRRTITPCVASMCLPISIMLPRPSSTMFADPLLLSCKSIRNVHRAPLAPPSSATFFAISCSKFKTRHIRLTAFPTCIASLPLIVKLTTLDAQTHVATLFQHVSAENYVSDKSEIEQKNGQEKVRTPRTHQNEPRTRHMKNDTKETKTHCSGCLFALVSLITHHTKTKLELTRGELQERS